MDLDPSTLNRALPLRDQIYHKIRNLIVVGQLKPGEVINEVAIAEALGVSRTPVREAVKRISDEGLVKILAQTGTYVAPISRADLEEAYVIRRALEMESARRAAAKFTAAASELLEDNMAAHRLAISRGRYATAIQLDDVFHRTIAEICGLPMIWRAVDISKAQMDRGRYLAIPRPGYGEQTIEQHEAIFDALCGKRLVTDMGGKGHGTSSRDVVPQHARSRRRPSRLKPREQPACKEWGFVSA
ncbi:GntR family transcriptional regulator [Mesorhizobium sp. L2C084A000]|uniref:GntR family transcriptional regulator n=3 Tax=unclassified Mesorhizobium TaxID=325217 RepID=UPI001FD9A59A|nr:GntR family transcriptional regulator [Mesorhizobium sp. L2C084A000]